jgi:hypothetical protein
VGVRRHDDDAVTLARQLDIVDETAAAGDEARIFQPRDRLANAEFIHVILLDWRKNEHDGRSAKARAIIGGTDIYEESPGRRMAETARG